jgi:hypothetical protein
MDFQVRHTRRVNKINELCLTIHYMVYIYNPKWIFLLVGKEEERCPRARHEGTTWSTGTALLLKLHTRQDEW